MRKVLASSVLLFAGLGQSQFLPLWLAGERDGISTAIHVLTMSGLAFIVVQIRFEFHIDKTNSRQYGEGKDGGSCDCAS